MYAVIDRFMWTAVVNKFNIITYFPTEVILLIPGFDVSDVISEDGFEFTSDFFLFSDSNNVNSCNNPPYMLFETLSVILYPK